MRKPDDSDFNRGVPLFYCPVCPMTTPAWLCELARDGHMLRHHPNIEFPEGSGLAEWHKMHEDVPVQAHQHPAVILQGKRKLRGESVKEWMERDAKA